MGPWEACFGAELDWEKLWRDQGSGLTEGPKCVREPKWDHGRLVLDQN